MPSASSDSSHRDPNQARKVDLLRVDKRIYACGFRNPYSFDWDRSGRLWVADVGDKCDEINCVKDGVNFGWQPPRTDCEGKKELGTVSGTRGQAGRSLVASGQYL
ncbi:MAG: PQQ-dependent sugar dehydrogenase [Solirubrobacterales bacterium]|nr:PQQ-dependent sugar dehydrogenase [Solirubrobacterales bacterium]